MSFRLSVLTRPIMLSAIMLSVIMLNVVMLSVVAPIRPDVLAVLFTYYGI